MFFYFGTGLMKPDGIECHSFYRSSAEGRAVLRLISAHTALRECEPTKALHCKRCSVCCCTVFLENDRLSRRTLEDTAPLLPILAPRAYVIPSQVIRD
jgi:hypothetical protein